MPNCRRQPASIQKPDQGFEFGTTEKQTQLVARTGIKSRTARSWIWRGDHWATLYIVLPHADQFITVQCWSSLQASKLSIWSGEQSKLQENTTALSTRGRGTGELAINDLWRIFISALPGQSETPLMKNELLHTVVNKFWLMTGVAVCACGWFSRFNLVSSPHYRNWQNRRDCSEEVCQEI